VQSVRKGIIQFKLSSVTQPVSRARADTLAHSAVRRILAADSQYSLLLLGFIISAHHRMRSFALFSKSRNFWCIVVGLKIRMVFEQRRNVIVWQYLFLGCIFCTWFSSSLDCSLTRHLMVSQFTDSTTGRMSQFTKIFCLKSGII